MLRLLTSLLFILFLASCGSSSTVGTGSGDVPEDPLPGEVTNELPEDNGPDATSPDDAVSEEVPVVEGSEPSSGGAQVITNDVIVDPRVTTPTELLLNPEDDSELWVRFVGGDPNCTAASVTVLTELPEVVEVELLVGITEDALTRSCMAGEFLLQVNVSLNEGATGKTLASVFGDEPGPILITPDLTVDDFVGLTEDEAAAIVEENLLTARTVRVDDEFFMVTEDYRPERLNFEVDDGVITTVTLG